MTTPPSSFSASSCCADDVASSFTRKSGYAMIPLADAVNEVLRRTAPLPPRKVSLMQAPGHVCASAVVASEDFPSFPASIMDGYAVAAPLQPGTLLPSFLPVILISFLLHAPDISHPNSCAATVWHPSFHNCSLAGVYKVVKRIHAGDACAGAGLPAGCVAYITTGAPLPKGANAVVKIEGILCSTLLCATTPPHPPTASSSTAMFLQTRMQWRVMVVTSARRRSR
jgi:gephyrin